MTLRESQGDLDELDKLLNDPDVPFQPDRVWDLLARAAARRAGPRPKPASLAERAAARRIQHS